MWLFGAAFTIWAAGGEIPRPYCSLRAAYCPLYAKEALTRAYKAYHALGGNDVATELYHDCIALPTEPVCCPC